MRLDHMDKPARKTTFLDFPEIPVIKQYEEGYRFTKEQVITQKVTRHEDITDGEKLVIVEAIYFYRTLINHLKIFDFSTLNNEEVEDFKAYYNYVFNGGVSFQTTLTLNYMYRAVKNESVIKSRNEITDKKFLSYPSLKIVKENDKYNRANTPSFNLFYGADTINTAINELYPEVGDLITVGVWKPKPLVKEFLCCTICRNHNAAKVNSLVKEGFLAFQQIRRSNHPLFSTYLDTIYNFISDEFAKPVVHNRNYLLSALFAEKLLGDPNSGFNLECMIYPSVSNSYSMHNLAFKPTVIEDKFDLVDACEFQVAKINNQPIYNDNTHAITVVDTHGLRAASIITEDGRIQW